MVEPTSSEATADHQGNDRTICEAIADVLKSAPEPLSATEIYEQVIARDLYHFKAQNPLNILSIQIRRHCKGLVFATAEPTKLFGLASNGKYFLLPKPIRVAGVSRRSGSAKKQLRREGVTFEQVMELHAQYVMQMRERILAELKQLTPTQFEHFGVKLLRAYGFSKLQVTRQTKDGGIDGFGRIKVGLAELCAAVQCKRWDKGSVGIFEVQRFRGAIQGKADQGVFFTTASFTSDAQKESFVPGAVPIVLIDGPQILDIMIEKRVGVTLEALEVPSLALDLAIQPEES